MKTKKQISLLLAAVMLISIFAGIFATPSKPTFSDVPADHWAYEFVEKAAKEGWVAGVGNGRFGVDNQVTYAEFATMLTRAYFSDELEALAMTFLPVEVPPVKEIFSISGCSVSHWPTSRPLPVSTLNTPSGTPASV